MFRGIAGAAILSLLAAGCSVSFTHTPLLPNESQLVRDQLIIHSDFRLPRTHRLVEELVALRTDISRRTGAPVSDEPIHVFLFENESEYRRLMRSKFPDLPRRRAWFVETDTRLSVFAYWGHHVAVDLRHEATHGYLHAGTPGLPLWLDEGLAEYFETPRSVQGFNVAHIRRLQSAMRRGDWRPDLKRLEKLAEPTQMTQSDYAECWAWTHFLLDSTPERRLLVRNYLAQLRMEAGAPALSNSLAQLDPAAPEAIAQHIQSLTLPAD